MKGSQVCSEKTQPTSVKGVNLAPELVYQRNLKTHYDWQQRPLKQPTVTHDNINNDDDDDVDSDSSSLR